MAVTKHSAHASRPLLSLHFLFPPLHQHPPPLIPPHFHAAPQVCITGGRVDGIERRRTGLCQCEVGLIPTGIVPPPLPPCPPAAPRASIVGGRVDGGERSMGFVKKTFTLWHPPFLLRLPLPPPPAPLQRHKRALEVDVWMAVRGAEAGSMWALGDRAAIEHCPFTDNTARIFRAFDTNGDGCLSPSETKVALQALQQRYPHAAALLKSRDRMAQLIQVPPLVDCRRQGYGRR
ncbi:unnamed protein product [Closterium sp. Naga37s-1]|nr:unnamed protein product [Closterium sp. Naga37s-1]